MGCDIHLFVEYRNPTWSAGYWKSLGSEFRLGRHYGIFSSLAGVRNYGDEIKPIAEPRGVPETISTAAREGYLYYVTDEPFEDRCVTPEKAKRWVESGASKQWDGKYITGPDWHTPSWLNPAEYEAAINFKIEGKEIRDTEDYQAVLAAMKSLQMSGFEVRTVFWFDN